MQIEIKSKRCMKGKVSPTAKDASEFIPGVARMGLIKIDVAESEKNKKGDENAIKHW